jgi:putative Mn2+ efflux pump MntP
MVDYIGQHIGEIASMVTILTALILGFRYVMNSFHKDFQEIREDIREIRQDTKETHQRIDAMGLRIDAMGIRMDNLYHYVLTKQGLK